MKKFSKNSKLNSVLNAIYEQITELNPEDVQNYKKEFAHETDFNIVQYGNLIVYYDDIRDFYKSHGYKFAETASDEKIWETYKQQVGYIVRTQF